jgi:hypothetical protein
MGEKTGMQQLRGLPCNRVFATAPSGAAWRRVRAAWALGGRCVGALWALSAAVGCTR